MANYHFDLSVISRGKGRSLTRHANYITGQTLRDDWNQTSYYWHRPDVLYCGVLLPDTAPSDYRNLQFLCSKMELAEKRWDARTGREIKASLPNELPLQENIRIVKEYIQTNFLLRNLCVIAAIHAGENELDPRRNNPHVHMILSTRTLGMDGFSAKKDRTLDRTANMKPWREQWALVQNEAYKRNNLALHVDHESLEVQGIYRTPTRYLQQREWRKQRQMQDNDGHCKTQNLEQDERKHKIRIVR